MVATLLIALGVLSAGGTVFGTVYIVGPACEMSKTGCRTPMSELMADFFRPWETLWFAMLFLPAAGLVRGGVAH